MREMTMRSAALLAAILALSCALLGSARDGDAKEEHGAPAATAPRDSSRADERFVDGHASLLERLSPLESGPNPDIRGIEARAILVGAEEMYLLGRTQIALELLAQADTALTKGKG
jgi:hypothetical protein